MLKMNMRKIFGIIGLAAVLVLPAMAEVGTIDFSITNSIAANATTSVNLGNAVSVTGQDNAGLMLKVQGNAAGTGLITITFARSPNNTDWETSPKFTWVNSLNGTTAVVGYTNLSSTWIGAAGYLKVVSIVNADASCTGTNASLTLVKKTIKASP
jgi:hypothetical protein